VGKKLIFYAFTYAKIYPFSEDHLKQWNSRKSTSGGSSSDMATPPKRQNQQDEENNQECEENAESNTDTNTI
jgi:hypothetical protein